MNVQSGRDFLNAHLAPLLPPNMKVIPYESNLDAIVDPVIMFRVRSLAKHPAAPSATYLATWTLTVISPLTDPARRDDDADDLAIVTLDALHAARIPWTTCEKAVWGSDYVCYDIAVNLPTSRTTTTTPEETP